MTFTFFADLIIFENKFLIRNKLKSSTEIVMRGSWLGNGGFTIKVEFSV
jgi:hypothetical protein